MALALEIPFAWIVILQVFVSGYFHQFRAQLKCVISEGPSLDPPICSS